MAGDEIPPANLILQALHAIRASVERTNDRLDSTNGRLDSVVSEVKQLRLDTNQRFNETNSRIDETNSRIDALRVFTVGSLTSLNDKVDTLGQSLNHLTSRVDHMGNEIHLLNERFDNFLSGEGAKLGIPIGRGGLNRREEVG